MNQNPMEELPSNSHKSQQAAKENNKPEKPAIPQFNGQVAGVKRKSEGQFGKWFRKMFLSDRKPSDILMDVVNNQIVPGIKDNFRNSVVSSLDMFIYQNTKSSSASNGNGISYSRIFNAQTANNAVARSQAPAPQQQQNGQDMNNGFTNPCFKSKMDAETFLRMMKEYDYPTLSVHTLYMMRKQHIDYTWDAYGWTKEEIAAVQVTHINNPDYPWMIDLPQAHVIS